MIFFSCLQFNAQEIQPYFGAVIVNNIDSSVAWYSDVLSLELLKREDDAERGFKIANLGNGKLLIELLELKSSISPKTILEKQPARTWMRGFMKIGFRVKNIESLFNEYKNKNIEFRGGMITDPVSGKKMFIINDPDSNPVQFFEL